MKNCEQMKKLSVLEHGVSVHSYFIDLYNHILLNEELKYEWKLPEWVYDLNLWALLEDKEVIKNYQIYHDCGKPYCLTIDDEGRKHFPNHAQVSSNIWRELSQSDLEADLMLHDMDIHLMKSNGVEEFQQLPYAATLLLTGLAELHSNASMFGGVSSTSFKIKWKSINKFGKRITNKLTEGK
jgi:hypothetical protein